MKHLALIPQYQKLRVSIRHGRNSFMQQERLGRALKIARIVNPDRDLCSHSSRRFNVWEAPGKMAGALEHVLKLSIMKKAPGNRLHYPLQRRQGPVLAPRREQLQ